MQVFLNFLSVQVWVPTHQYYSHQAYAHKLLTGRFDAFPTIRQYGGLSGFLKRTESEYDVFGAGHASTSISAGVGIALVNDPITIITSH